MNTLSADHFALKVTGSPGGNVDCENEAFSVDGTALTMPGYGTAGDCATDQFKKAGLKFLGAEYDAAADTVTVHAKYLFVKVTIVASKQSLAQVMAAGPSGHYHGNKNVMGFNVQLDMNTLSADHFALKVTGSPGGNVDCENEAFSVDGTALTMPGYGTAGDCATDQFKKAGLKFLGAEYDAAA